MYLYWNRLYESTGDLDQAAAAYHQYIIDSEAEGTTDDRDQQSKAYKYLAHYHTRRGNYEEANHFAQKCTEYADTREDGKALLKEISSKCHDIGLSDPSMFSTPAPLTAPLGPMGPIDRNLERVLRENNSSFASPQESTSSTPRDRDLEPMNLSFTPWCKLVDSDLWYLPDIFLYSRRGKFILQLYW